MFLFLNKKKIPVRSFTDFELDLELKKKGDVINLSQFPIDLTFKIDTDYRKAVMRAHSCQHLLSAILFTKYHIKTVKAAMEEDTFHVFLDQLPSSEVLLHLIQDINNSIIESRAINSHILTQGSKVNQHGQEILTDRIRGSFLSDKKYIRLVEIEGIDLNACGGTHLSSTGEIIAFAIYGVKKKELLLYSGKKALEFQARANNNLVKLSKLVKRPVSDGVDTAMNLITDLSVQTVQIKSLLTRSLSTLCILLKEKISKEFNENPTFDLQGIIENNQSMHWHSWAKFGQIFLIIECPANRKVILEALATFSESNLNFVIAVIMDNESVLLHVTKSSKTTANGLVMFFQENTNQGKVKGGGSPKVAQLIFTDISQPFEYLHHTLTLYSMNELSE